MKKVTPDSIRKGLSVVSLGKPLGNIAVDISDIHESCIRVQEYIEDIQNKSLNREEIEEILIELEVELDHVNWHYKSFKKELKTLSWTE